MRNFIALTAVLLISQMAMATTFIPVSVKKQIKESEGIIEGVVENIEYEKNSEGRIETKVSIFANKWMGHNPNEGSVVEIYYPGGRIGDEEYQVSGSPELNIGENVVLFTRSHDNKQYVQNLGLGKFSIQKIGKKYVMINQIFPNYPDVGQMRMDQFYGLAEWVKKKKFHERFKDKYELEQERRAQINNKKQAGRSIASVKTEESKRSSMLWLLFVFGLLLYVSQFIRRKNK